MSASVPIIYTKDQYRNMVAMASSGLRTLIPITRPSDFPSPDKFYELTLKAPPDSLVDQYAAWCGAPKERYAQELPPHFCSHWALSMLSTLGASVPYNVFDILNQGARIQVNQPIPRGRPLHIKGNMVNVQHTETRIRIHVRITTSTDQYQHAHILDSYLSVPLKTAVKRVNKNQHTAVSMQEIGTWSAGPSAGVDFARLTGDFNPIHVLSPIGRLAGFGGCILHGFGFMARSWEICRNSGMDIYDADLRFVKPLQLPTKTLSVQLSERQNDNESKTLQLIDSSGAIYLAGNIFTSSKPL